MNLINKDSKILIVGDSWGCGEWSLPAFGQHIQHTGLEFYLKEYGCNVVNKSYGGYSNDDIFHSLEEQIEFSYDVIIWFQTDPLRNLRPYINNLEIFKKNKEDFLKIKDELLDSIYNRFNSLSVPIYCLGGVANLNLTLIEKYNNLYPIIPSIIEMFGDTHIKIWPTDWIQDDNITSVLSHSLVDYLYQDCNIKLNKNWFFPDGHHPNRLAHKKIFEYLIDFKLPD